MNFNKKAVVLSSGGLDSTTVLAMVRSESFDVYSLSFSYGQRHDSWESKPSQRIVKC